MISGSGGELIMCSRHIPASFIFAALGNLCFVCAAFLPGSRRSVGVGAHCSQLGLTVLCVHTFPIIACHVFSWLPRY